MPSIFRKSVGLKQRHWEFIQCHPEINYSALFQAVIDQMIEEEKDGISR